MKTLTLLLTFLLAAYFVSGCQQNTTPTTAVAGSSVAINAEDMATSDPQQEPDEQHEPGRADRFLNKAGDILKKATEARADGDGVSKDWILKQIQQATEGQEGIPEDATEWAKKMYDVLKDKGLTGAGDAGQWVTEDIRNMNAFKYKVVKVSLDDLPALEDELNNYGQLKWECFHVAERSGETIMFFKKERRSLLKNIPVRDMLKIVPLMSGDE